MFTPSVGTNDEGSINCRCRLDELWLGARGPLIGEGVYLAIQERRRKAGL